MYRPVPLLWQFRLLQRDSLGCLLIRCPQRDVLRERAQVLVLPTTVLIYLSFCCANVVQIPAAKESLNANAKTGYITWLGGIVKRMNATFHPRLPGNFPQLHRQLFSICSSSMLLIGLLVCKNPDITNRFVAK